MSDKSGQCINSICNSITAVLKGLAAQEISAAAKSVIESSLESNIARVAIAAVAKDLAGISNIVGKIEAQYAKFNITERKILASYSDVRDMVDGIGIIYILIKSNGLGPLIDYLYRAIYADFQQTKQELIFHASSLSSEYNVARNLIITLIDDGFDPIMALHKYFVNTNAKASDMERVIDNGSPKTYQTKGFISLLNKYSADLAITACDHPGINLNGISRIAHHIDLIRKSYKRMISLMGKIADSYTRFILYKNLLYWLIQLFNKASMSDASLKTPNASIVDMIRSNIELVRKLSPTEIDFKTIGETLLEDRPDVICGFANLIAAESALLSPGGAISHQKSSVAAPQLDPEPPLPSLGTLSLSFVSLSVAKEKMKIKMKVRAKQKEISDFKQYAGNEFRKFPDKILDISPNPYNSVPMLKSHASFFAAAWKNGGIKYAVEWLQHQAIKIARFEIFNGVNFTESYGMGIAAECLDDLSTSIIQRRFKNFVNEKKSELKSAVSIPDMSAVAGVINVMKESYKAIGSELTETVSALNSKLSFLNKIKGTK